MQILRRKDVPDYEAAALLEDAEEYGPAARWYGTGCAAAGFAPGSVVYAYYLKQVAGYVGTQDVTCAGDDPAAIAAALEADEVAPGPDMGEEWVIATFPHGEWQCPQWPFPHVHSLIAIGTPREIRKAMRDYEEGMARTW